MPIPVSDDEQRATDDDDESNDEDDDNQEQRVVHYHQFADNTRPLWFVAHLKNMAPKNTHQIQKMYQSLK